MSVSKLSSGLLLVALSLSGCGTTQGSLLNANAHAVSFQPINQRVVFDEGLPITPQAEAALAGLVPDALRADVRHGEEVTAAEREELRRALQRSGLQASHIRYVAEGKGRAILLHLHRAQAHAVDCQRTTDGGFPGSAGKWFSGGALNKQHGCSVNANLAAQMARPQDVQSPGNLDDVNAVRAVGAVEAYQRGSIREFNEQAMEVGGGSGPM